MLPGIRSALMVAQPAPQSGFLTAFNGTTSVTLSGILAGDMLILNAWDDSNTFSTPSLPAGWTNLASGTTGAGQGYRIAYKLAAGGETGTGSLGTFTTAANVCVYRGGTLSIGANSGINESSGSSATFLSVTLQTASGTSLVHSGILASSVSPATPSGLVLRASGASSRAYDTGVGVTSFGSRTSALGIATDWITFSVEIKKA